MAEAYHESLHPFGNLGIEVSLAALEAPHIPMHWHDSMEILFCLNGDVTVYTEKENYSLSKNQLIVFDSKEVHSINSASSLYMFLCMHVDKKQLSVYCPELELYNISCHPLPLDDPKAPKYIRLCQLARELTRTNIQDNRTRSMQSDGISLLMLADLVEHFSEYAPPKAISDKAKPNDTVRDIISYVNEHYKEKISLDDIAAQAGFSREYFCRFFKQHIGVTFLQYLNEVRISHAGRLLMSTDMSIAEVMRESGFTNQTIFNRTFKELYGMTPRHARNSSPEDKYL